MKIQTLLIFIFTLATFVGCSSFRRTDPKRELNSQGQPRFYSQSLDTVKKQEIKVSRAALIKALSVIDAPNRIRLVELYGTSEKTPRYKIMSLDRSGVYPLLGLKVGDFILAADNFIIYNQEIFPKFISILPQERHASIHILRNGSELLLVYSIE